MIIKGKVLAVVLTAAFAATAYAPASRAFDFGDMMNPSRMMSPGSWMGGNNDSDEDYGPRGGGPGSPGGYGGGPRGHGGGPGGPGAYGAGPGPYGPGGYAGPGGYGGPGGPGGYGGPGDPAPYGAAPYGYYGSGPARAPGGYGPPGGYGRAPSVAAPVPQPSQDQSSRIRSLEWRIQQLEAQRQAPQAAPQPHRPPAPTYRSYGQ